MASNLSIPRRLPILLVADGILLPGSSMRIPVNSQRNMNLVKSRILRHNTLSSTVIGVVPRESTNETDDFTAIHHIGTAAVVVQVTGTNWPRPAYTLLVTGLCRFKLEKLLQETPYPVAQVVQLDKLPGQGTDFGDDHPVMMNFREQAGNLVDLLDIAVPVVAKLKKLLESLPTARLLDIFASIVKASYSEKLQVLDAIDLEERIKRTLPLLARQIEGLKLLQRTRANSGPHTLRDRQNTLALKNVLKKVNIADMEEENELDEITDLEHKIRKADMPPHAHKACHKELKRLKKTPTAMPEYGLIRNYLELMVELPWSKQSTDTLDIKQARRDLDVDHYGLDKLKRRVVEYLAVRQLKNSLKGPILCFVGPPGVGKTSVGRSIAHTLGRTFHRISLGGCCDQSDIRGHRRTYIGSMPGRIIHGLKLVGTNNPVFLLDEIDKLGKSMQGDPAAALLEVLDPEQNNAFTDHYLNVPFDLSQVLFIATANSTGDIPPALKDRMELINVPGYTQEEKLHIATRHLIPKQLKEHGLTAEQIQFPENSVKIIIAKYTREAGVRTLERKIGAVCRAVAVHVAETQTRSKTIMVTANKTTDEEDDGGHDVDHQGTELLDKASLVATADAAITHPPDMPIVIDKHAVKDILGIPVYESEMSERLLQPGVAVGLAWTALGGEIMYVEATKMDGDGTLTLTGQLGDVMKESATLALNWVRTHAKEYGILAKEGVDLMENTDVHIHFPAGAVGKDGPSAGITIVTVLTSLFSDRHVCQDTAMTGEITLRGLVLPVGGIKAKVLAAHRAGIKRIILPKRNEKDLEEVPQSIKNDLKFIPVSRLEEVLQAAFDDGFSSMIPQAEPTVIPSKL
ncbi:lon protease homolog 2, peroxisomal-like [Patiria miniata]|uniref:Lon protease homolog 2, peroxisomal n=1 Tax=Patiria miniata TaxID=46514 RepID=A0A914AYR0_PATMI|nr:lon protease homolog 2, peroxisomal-like [Patiria miniata]